MKRLHTSTHFVHGLCSYKSNPPCSEVTNHENTRVYAQFYHDCTKKNLSLMNQKGLQTATSLLSLRIPLFFMLFLLCTSSSVIGQWYNGADALDVRFEAPSVAANGKLYVFTGYTTGFQLSDPTEEYDPVTDTWSALPAMPLKVNHSGVVLVNNNEVWFVGGRKSNNTQVADVQIYNIATQTWSTGPNLPAPRAGGGVGLLNNKIHYFTGFGNDVSVDKPDHYVLDLNNLGAGWTTAAPFPDPRNHLSSAVVNGKLYSIGGQYDHDGSGLDLASVYSYDPNTDTWATETPLPGVNSHFEPGTFVSNGKIICVGGEILSDAVLEYDPITKIWTQISTLPIALRAPAANIINGKLIVAHGGESGTIPTKKTYLLNLAVEGNNPPVLAGIGNQTSAEGAAISLQLSATDSDGDGMTYAASGLPAALTLNATTGLISGTLTAAVGTHIVSVSVTDDGDPALTDVETFTWEIEGTAEPVTTGDPIYRVNAGGISLVDAPVDWELDKEATPVAYVNFGVSNNTTGWDGGWTGTNTTGAPDLIFVTDRWDGPWGDEMQWDFPVTNGTYEVNLYFCEYKDQYSVAGTRFFDVSLEGQLVLDDYDIIVDAGFNAAAKKSFIITVTDGNIDIDFDRVIGGENPKINGIEILTASSNAAPVIAAIADQSSEQGESPSITASATDADGDNITYSALNLPTGLSINPATGEISGTITAAAGVFNVSVTATDNGTPNMSATTTFDWTITLPNQPPAIDAIADQTHDEGATVSLMASATDPEGDNISWGAIGLPTGLSINPTTGEISGTISAAAANFNVEITATDDGSPIESASVSFVWYVVVPVNDPPVLAAIGAQTDIEGASVSLSLSATDPEGDNLSFGATGLPAGLTINPTTGLISGTLTAAVGTYAVTVTVTDDGIPNLNDTETFDWVVSPPNQAPVLAAMLDQLNQEGETVSVTAFATDPEGDNLSFVATALPAGVTMNPTTGEMSGTLTALAGTYAVTVTVTDDGLGNLTDVISFNWIISLPPVAGGALFRINAGGTAIPTPSMAWALDKQGTPSPYLDPANNQTTGWYGGFDVTGGINNTIAPDSLFGEYRLDASWSPSPGIKYSFPLDNGNYEVKLFFAEYQNEAVGARFFDVLLEGILVLDDYDIVATDGFKVAVEKTFVVEVNDGTLNVLLQRVAGGDYPLLSGLQVAGVASSNMPPNVTAIADQSTAQTLPVSLQIAASDPDGNNLSFNAIGLPTGLSIDTNGLISGNMTAAMGDYNVSIQVIDDGTPVADSVISFLWTVLPPPNIAPVLAAIDDQTNFEGDVVSLGLSASDADGDNLSFSATGLPAGLTIHPTTGEISGTLTALEGVYPVTVTVTDDGPGTLSDNQSFDWAIFEVNIAPDLAAIVNQTHEEGETVSVALSATDANGDNLIFSAIGLPAGLSINPATGLISGTISAPFDTYNVSITVTDDGVPVLTDVESFDWIIVEPPNQAPVLAVIADRTDEQGEGVSETASATDPEGDNLSFTATNLPAGLSMNPATGEMSGTITATPALYIVEVIVTDDGTPLIASDTLTFNWTVSPPVNDPPVLAFIADQAHIEAEVVSVTVSATDVENDNLTFGAFGLPAGLTINPATGEISGTLTAPADVYIVTVNVTDDGTPNESDSQTFNWTINPPNQAPIITAIGDQNHYVGETVSVQILATDPEGDNITFSALGLPAGLSINFASGMISGTISAAADTYGVTITATDDGTPVESSDYVFDWIIEIPPNNPPALSAIADRSDESGNIVMQSVSASDIDGDALTFSATGLPTGVNINPATGEMSGTILDVAGDYVVTVTVTDNGTPNLSDSQIFIWTVTPYINEKPVLAGIPDQENAIGEPISFYASASDPDGDNLFFSANNLPASLGMDPLTGEIQGVIIGPEGVYQVQILVWDDGTPALSDTIGFSWTVNPAVPPISGDPVYRINAGGDAVPQAPMAWMTDKQSDSAPYLAPGNNQTSGWGPGFINNGGVNNTDAPNLIFGTYRKDATWSGNNLFGYNFPVVNGFYEVNLFFAEADGLAPGGRVMDILLEGNIGFDDYDIAADVGQNVAVMKSIMVEVTDGNLDLDFVSVGGTETAQVRGIEIRASGNSAPLFAMSNQVHEEFETVSVFVNASDPEGDNITYAATGLPDGLGINAVTGEMSGTIVADTGDYVVTLIVTDDGQPIESTSRTFTWTVLPTPQPNYEPVLTMNDQTHEEGQTVSVTILAADPDGDVLTFAATGLPAGLTLNPATGVISGTISALANTYPVNISVTDDGTPNLTTTRDIDWVIIVAPPNHAPVISPIADQSFMEGMTVSIPVNATDQDGDNLTFSATGLPAGISINPTTGEISGTITGSFGLYAVTVTVTDDGEPVLTDTDIFNFTVEESQVAACFSLLDYETDIIFASNFEEGSTKIYNLSPNGEKIVRVSLDIRNIMYPDFSLDDGIALGGNMGTPGFKVPTQDPGSSPVGYVQGSHIYEYPHQPFPILDPSVLVGYQGFTLNFNPNLEGGFEAGETFVFSWDTDPTNISYVTTNNGPGGGGKTSGLDLAGTKVTIEWDNGAIITKELWYSSGTVAGSQAFFNNNTIPRPSIDIPALPQDSMRVDSVNHIVRVTGEPGRQVSLIVGEGGNYYTGDGIPEGGYDPDYFEMNNVFAFEEIDNYIIGPAGYVDIPITLNRSDLSSFNIELPEELTKHWVIRAALRSDEDCTSLPCNSACTSPVSNLIYLMYDPGAENYNPYITPIASQTNEEGETISLPIEAYDPEAGVLTCSATGLPAGLSIDPATGLISGMITAAPGDYHVFVTVTDDGTPAKDTTRHFDWKILPSTNDNPILAAIGNQTNQIGEMVSLNVSASDPNGDGFTFSATGLPIGLTIDPTTGEISGTVTAVPGDYSVTVVVTDDAIPNKIDSETFTWTITPNNPPVIVDVADLVTPQTTFVSLQVSASDPDGHAITFSAAGLPAGLSINPATGEISGTVTDLQGAYPVQVVATDNGIPNLSDTTNFTWTIAAPPNQAPQLTNLGDQQDEEGATVSVVASANDPDGDELTYSAIGLPGGLTMNPATGEISGSITGVQGAYPVQIIVVDNNSPSMGDTLNIIWTVTAPPNQPPVLDAIADQTSDPNDAVNINVVSATDPEGDNISFSAINLPQGLIIDANSGAISGTITAAPATYQVSIIATDDGIPAESDTVTFDWIINVPPNQAPMIAAVPNQANEVGEVISLSVSATDPEGDVILFNATNLPTGLSIGALSGEISGTIAAPVGTFNVMIVATDNGSPSESDTLYFDWVVTNPANQAPSVAGIATQTNEEGEVVSLQVNASDPEGDNLTYAATGLPAGLSMNISTGEISGTITAGAALFGVSVTVTDDGTPNQDSTITFDWLVTSPPNQAPTIATIADQVNDEGETILTLQVSASDPEGDNLTYSASGLPDGLTIDTNTGEITGTITALAGTFFVTITVTDDGTPNESDIATFSWLVLDPNSNTPPVITAINDQTNEAGESPNLQVQAMDPEGQTLFFSAVGLPSGLGIDPITGLISGTINAAPGDYTVTVTVLDLGSPSASSQVAFIWTIIAPSGRLAAPATLLPNPSVFPNPVEEIFTLVIPTEIEGLYTVVISDMSGKVVYEENELEETNLRIHVGHLPEGIYMLKVKTANHQYRPIYVMKK